MQMADYITRPIASDLAQPFQYAKMAAMARGIAATEESECYILTFVCCHHL